MKAMTSLAGLREGQKIPVLEVEIDRAALVRYAGASDDYAYQHWDHPKMVELGFPDVVVHGWLTFAHMVRAVSEWIPRELAEVATYAVRYRKPTFPGRITCGGRILGIHPGTDGPRIELELWSRDAGGEITTTASMRLQAP
jgi:acyl dehydratase